MSDETQNPFGAALDPSRIIEELPPPPEFHARLTEAQLKILEDRPDLKPSVLAMSILDQKLDWIMETQQKAWKNQCSIKGRLNHLEENQAKLFKSQATANNWFKDLDRKKKLAAAACVLLVPGLVSKFPDLLGVIFEKALEGFGVK